MVNYSSEIGKKYVDILAVSLFHEYLNENISDIYLLSLFLSLSLSQPMISAYHTRT